MILNDDVVDNDDGDDDKDAGDDNDLTFITRGILWYTVRT